MSIDRRDFLRGLASGAASGAAALAMPAFAQRAPVRIFVGFPAGGLPDLVARALAEQFRKSFDVTVLVENRAGANGRIAGQAVKAGPADGTTFLVAPASNIVHIPHVYSDLGFDPMTDFVPVAQTLENDFAFACSARIPPTTLQEYATWAKANPGQSTFGSPGAGSSPHLMGLQIARALGMPLAHVPYKGSNFALTDLQGGHIASMVSVTSFLLPSMKAGSLRVLATTGNNRSAPTVPTFKELGIPQLTLTEGTWLLAPAKTPQAVIDRYSAAAIEAVKGKEMQALIDATTTAAPLNARDLAKVMRDEYDRRGATIRQFGFTAG